MKPILATAALAAHMISQLPTQQEMRYGLKIKGTDFLYSAKGWEIRFVHPATHGAADWNPKTCKRRQTAEKWASQMHRVMVAGEGFSFIEMVNPEIEVISL